MITNFKDYSLQDIHRVRQNLERKIQNTEFIIALDIEADLKLLRSDPKAFEARLVARLQRTKTKLEIRRAELREFDQELKEYIAAHGWPE